MTAFPDWVIAFELPSAMLMNCCAVTRLAASHSCWIAGAAENLVHPLLCQLSQPIGRRTGERLEPRRQRVAHLGRDVDLRVHLVDDGLGDLSADGVVLQQRGAGVRPVVRVEHLAVRPDREDRDHREQESDREQPADQVAPSPGQPRRRGRPPQSS